MTLKIERDKLYRLRNGEIVRVICLDVFGDFNCMGYKIDQADRVHRWNTNGESIATTDYNIIAEHREPRNLWVKFYNEGGCATRMEPGGEGWIKFREVLE